jgi:hypothetical protein
MRRKKINVCIKCGSDDIKIGNCGYSSFNAGSGKCNQCKNKVIAHNGSWSEDNWIIEEWNCNNPTKEQEIEQIECQIESLQKQIEKAKQRKW